MTDQSVAERHILALLREKYEEDGFTFVVHPSSELLPSAFGGYRPDAIALKESEKIAIEVGSRAPTGPNPVEIKERVRQADGWKLRIVYPGDVEPDVSFSRSREFHLAERRAELTALRDAGHMEAAILYAWSVLEAAMAARLSGRVNRDTDRPLSTLSLIAQLETLGEVERADSKQLRALLALRNALAHGDYDRRPTAGDLDALLSIIDRLSPVDHAA